jgi:hypothetical protein
MNAILPDDDPFGDFFYSRTKQITIDLQNGKPPAVYDLREAGSGDVRPLIQNEQKDDGDKTKLPPDEVVDRFLGLSIFRNGSQLGFERARAIPMSTKNILIEEALPHVFALYGIDYKSPKAQAALNQPPAGVPTGGPDAMAELANAANPPADPAIGTIPEKKESIP